MTLRLSPSVRATKQVGAFRSGPPQHVLVGAVAADGRAAEARWQPLERPGRDVEHDHLVPGGVPQLGGGCADSAAADDRRSSRWFLAHRLAHDPDGARRVLQDVRDRSGRWRTPRRTAYGTADRRPAGPRRARSLRRRSPPRRRGPAAAPAPAPSCAPRRWPPPSRARAGPPPSGPRCRHRAAGSSRSRRRGRRSAPPSSSAARPATSRTIRASLGPPLRAMTARRKGAVSVSGMGGHDTTAPLTVAPRSPAVS